MQLTSDRRYLIDLMREIAAKTYSELTISYRNQIVELNSDFAEGVIFGHSFQDCFGILVLDIKLKESLKIEFLRDRNYPFRFLFLSEGGVRHSIGGKVKPYSLNPLTGAITASPLDATQELIFPENQRIKLVIVEVEREKFKQIITEDFSMPEPFKDMITDDTMKNFFLYQNRVLVGINDSMEEIFDYKSTDFLQRILLEIKALEIIYFLSKKYKKEFDGSEKSFEISQYDLNRIMKARELMVSNLEAKVIIEHYSKEVGMSLTKFKREFRKVFEMPPYRYLVLQKLNRARLLLSENNYTISEVAGKVGYKNVSKFSQKFKAQFGQLPNEFVKIVKEVENGRSIAKED